MKKQIAVLMAAATAVTTVAPALASAADVNNYEVSASEINAKIKAALNERYKDKTADGINASNANEVDDYLNSRYAVILYVAGNPLAGNQLDGLLEFTNSKYDVPKINDAINDGNNGNVFEVSPLEKTNLYVVKNASKVQNLIENKVIGGNNDVKVAIIDKGIKDGSAVETLTDKHYVTGTYKNNKYSVSDSDTQVSLEAAASDLIKQLKYYGGKDDTKSYIDTLKLTLNGQEVTVSYNNDGEMVTAPENTELSGQKGITDEQDFELENLSKIKLTLESGKEYTLENDDKAFDLKKPVDKNGNDLELANAAQNIYDQVDGFKFIENEDGKKATVVLPAGNTDVYTVQDVQASTVELGKIFTKKDGYTKEGADFVNSIVNARKGKNGNYGFNYNGVNYNLVDNNGHVISKNNNNEHLVGHAFKKAVIEADNGGYQLRYDVRVKNANDDSLDAVTLQFVIKGDSQKDLNIVLRDLEGKNTVAQGHFTRLEGADRYATAIEVSNEKFDPKDADTVVIVGGEALMDGLSAVPLAAAKNAPILLSHPKSGLNDATLSEISRACRDLNRKTVYVVGGENSVPQKAVKQLEDKFGAVVVRVSGSDRYDTSLEVAKRLTYDKDVTPGTSNLFITGGEGAADAMSVSPVAATKSNGLGDNTVYGSGSVTPILVVPKDSVKRSTREFIDDFGGQGYIIGGESTVSTNAYRDLNQAMSQRITRIAGSDRFDTNVQILKKFYAKDSSAAGAANKIVVGGAIFASGDNKYLVDAQTAGPLAAEENAPIVLAGSKLTNDQVDLLKNDGLLSKLHSNVYQVGGVVSSDVMSVVVDKLGL
ncbi:cell wall-binding repeat-containing protein [Peptostreptococcus russellii]|uniref:cell wall-binding repeat-containing protein n=1 Tax=Peptostreptococcus russellii TaxID=215200 RepID=UPI0016296C51|nr:cell wall-binding repeat-containing protein [Peptostreptococcus russellii]MBC2578476.1 cell wall-binding repeat-containing protein [Peptostreptococcus russellii]